MSFDPSTGLTCVTCQLVFSAADVQREHYKTDWHRYNMKRQFAELPPVTDEQFREKVLTFRNKKQTEAVEEEQSLYCSSCKKSMKSKNAYEQHLASNKHKENEKQANSKEIKGPRQPRKKPENLPKPPEHNDVEMEGDDDDSSGWETDHGSDDEADYDFDEAQALPVTSCLFCPQTKSNGEESLEHMRFHHGFQIPDKKYLTDEVGLLKYLGLKVGAGRCCIFCPDVKSRYATVAACQAHMRDKQHCKLPREPERMLEYAEYYDFSPMYENDDEASVDTLYDDGWTLTLPSGAKIGHRSLMVYYRQYLRPVDGTPRNSGRLALDRARGMMPALAWTGTTGVAAKQVAKDLKFVERYRRRFDVRVACRSNKLFKTRGRVGDN